VKFFLNQVLRIKRTGHTGDCIGRAEYAYSSVPSYQIAYTDAQGNSQKGWFEEPELENTERSRCVTCKGRGTVRQPPATGLTACPDCAKKSRRLTDNQWFDFWQGCDLLEDASMFPEFLTLVRTIETAIQDGVPHGQQGGAA